MMNPAYRDVLVVDDHADLRASLSHTLRIEGFHVRTANNGVEALEAVRQECPHYLITDWCMHPMDGIEFCRQLRLESLPHYVYTILLTIKNDGEAVITALNAGADDFMSKPVRRAELLARFEAGARVLELEDRLSQLARCDPLTGVLNCRTAKQLLEKEWARAIRYRHPLSCVMWDVDYFKAINDMHGHLVGDKALQYLAQLAESQCRCPDYVCRWGGDEFLVLLPETNAAGAFCWAERFCASIAATPLAYRSFELPISASFGVAERQTSMPDPSAMIELADQALYAAKREGRCRVVLAESITMLAGVE